MTLSTEWVGLGWSDHYYHYCQAQLCHHHHQQACQRTGIRKNLSSSSSSSSSLWTRQWYENKIIVASIIISSLNYSILLYYYINYTHWVYARQALFQIFAPPLTQDHVCCNSIDAIRTISYYAIVLLRHSPRITSCNAMQFDNLTKRTVVLRTIYLSYAAYEHPKSIKRECIILLCVFLL